MWLIAVKVLTPAPSASMTSFAWNDEPEHAFPSSKHAESLRTWSMATADVAAEIEERKMIRMQKLRIKSVLSNALAFKAEVCALLLCCGRACRRAVHAPTSAHAAHLPLRQVRRDESAGDQALRAVGPSSSKPRRARRKRQTLTSQERKELRSVFDLLDADSSGSVAVQELVDALYTIGVSARRAGPHCGSALLTPAARRPERPPLRPLTQLDTMVRDEVDRVVKVARAADARPLPQPMQRVRTPRPRLRLTRTGRARWNSASLCTSGRRTN